MVWKPVLVVCLIACLALGTTGEATVAKRFLAKLQTASQLLRADPPKINQQVEKKEATKPAQQQKVPEKPTVAPKAPPKVAAPKAPPKPALNIDKTPVPLTKKEVIKMKKVDLGAVTFFEEFDQDKDGAWSENEYNLAMTESKRRRYLPANFDAKGQWATLQKNVDGKVELKTFLAWAMKTPAHSPPKPKVKPKKTTKDKKPETGPAHCVKAFQQFDKNTDGFMQHEEFVKAVEGKMSADGVEDVWADMKRTGPKGAMQLKEWNDLCSSMTGLAKGPREALEADPCNPNPCHESGTICQREPKKCATDPCPQYKCVRPGVKTSGKFKAYKQCEDLFKALDDSRDDLLSEMEFKGGLTKAAAGSNKLIRPKKVATTWTSMQKNKKGLVDKFEFVHWCVAVKNNGGGSGSVVKEECWDVFKAFDKDKSSDLSRDEFTDGMRKGKSQGHIPVSLNIKKAFATLPKNKKENVPQGPFIVWCGLISRGIDPIKAAAYTIKPIPAKPGAAGPVGWKRVGAGSGSSQNSTNSTNNNSTKSANSTTGGKSGTDSRKDYLNAINGKNNTNSTGNSSTAGGGKASNGNSTTNATTVVDPRVLNNSIWFCRDLFNKANVDSAKQSKHLVMDEFHAVCEDLGSAAECKTYTSVFAKWDTDRDGQLSKPEFVSGCKTMSKPIAQARAKLALQTGQQKAKSTTKTKAPKFKELLPRFQEVQTDQAALATASAFAIPSLPPLQDLENHDDAEAVMDDIDEDVKLEDLALFQLAMDPAQDEDAAFLDLGMEMDLDDTTL